MYRTANTALIFLNGERLNYLKLFVNDTSECNFKSMVTFDTSGIINCFSELFQVSLTNVYTGSRVNKHNVRDLMSPFPHIDCIVLSMHFFGHGVTLLTEESY